MKKGIMLLYVASVYIASIGLAVRVDKGSHSPIIRRLLRKTNTLKQDLAIVSSTTILATTTRTTSTTTTPIPTTTTIPTTMTTTEFRHSCGKGWLGFNSHCYLISTLWHNITWNGASDYCKDNGSYLIEIDNDKEMDFLYDVLFPDIHRFYWIGATDLTSDGEFRYINSGEKVQDDYWATEQLDMGYRDEHCVYMWRTQSGIWLYDLSCWWRGGFVCEKP